MTEKLDLGRLGWPGLIGVALLLGGISYGIGTVWPAFQMRASLRATETRLQAQLQTTGVLPLAAEFAKPPPLSDAPRLLARFTALGETYKWPLDQASFRFVRTNDAYVRCEATVAVRTDYSTFRRFLDAVTALSPTLTIDDLSLKRASATEPGMDAMVRLSFHFLAE